MIARTGTLEPESNRSRWSPVCFRKKNLQKEAPISLLVAKTMPKPLIHRHSADCFDIIARESKSFLSSDVHGKDCAMVDSSQGELSLSDLSISKPRRRQRNFGTNKFMEDTSSKTALTASGSFNRSSYFGSSLSQERSSTANVSSRNFGTSSRGALDTSSASTQSSLHRNFGDTSLNEDGSVTDNSLCSASSTVSSSSRIRCLKRIRRRRSDPATSRWREQCSRLFKEHVLDACPEQQTALAITITAANKIQYCVRRFLIQKKAKNDK